jgi:zinc protease
MALSPLAGPDSPDLPIRWAARHTAERRPDRLKIRDAILKIAPARSGAILFCGYSMRMKTVCALVAAILPAAVSAAAQPLAVDIPFEKFVLPNGLTVIVHEDHKAPVVAVNIWYHVGSKNEKPGKTGFAHLFEHLMFNGSEHFNQDYFKVLEKLGATNLNGTTSNDRTNYFQNVPTSALDTALWMESDRMGHLLKAIDQGKLDEQRGVVQNEKRQYENQPYGKAEDLLETATYPVGHPYSWSVIGSMEDLNAARLEDVHEWFRTYYGPTNAVLVLAGDIDARTAREKTLKYFGAIPPGPPVAKQRAWIARMQGSRRATMEDRVPQARLYRVWNTPEDNTTEATLLQMAAEVMGGGRTSRLYKRLVVQDQLATEVHAYAMAREIGGQFEIMASARPGVDLQKVEAAIDEEMARFLASGPAAEELDRVRARRLAQFVRGLERIGGFGGKSDALARSQVFAGDPAAYKKRLEVFETATVADVKSAAANWLSDGVFNMEVRPFGRYKAQAVDADRSKVPEPGPAPEAKLPRMQRATLANGLKLILVERHELPIVDVVLAVDAGTASDVSSLPGVSSLAMNMLQEGTATRKSAEISEQLENLGAQLRAGSAPDASTVALSAMKNRLDSSLEIFADVALNPSFPEREFRRLQKMALTGIMREKASPAMSGMRVLPGLLFGKQHPYGQPLSGAGDEKSVAAITRDTLATFHQTWFKPNNATVIVVGDTTVSEISPKLENIFRKWKQGSVPAKSIARVEQQPKSVVYLIDRPGAEQSVILAGHVAPVKANPDEAAYEVMNTILGGAFISRVNMNIREDKHWSYGARTALRDARGQRIFYASAPVQSDKTKESMVEIDKELRGIVRDRPVTSEELNMAKESRILRVPGSLESSAQVAASILELVEFGLPDDYHDTYTGRIRKLTREDVTAAAEKLIRPDRVVWVVVGDRAKVEAGIRSLNFGEVRNIDADGNAVK